MVEVCALCYYGMATAVLISILSYVVPYIFSAYICCEQNLKKRYGAEWAVVTGASSGIGLSITRKLAAQGINVVMVGLEEPLLTKSYDAVVADFPDVKLIRCGTNQGKPGYMDAVKAACKDIRPSLIFNNAGYILTGMFADTTAEAQMANYTCNATSAVELTHHFAAQMKANGQKGLIAYTSSPAGFMPCPLTVMYGATKAFLTEFATSLAPELYVDGIDILVVHPSPTNTGFYAGNKHDIGAMKFFQKTATTADTIAACFFKSAGRVVVHDQGYFCICLKLLLKLVDYNFLAVLFCRTANTSDDFKKSQVSGKKKK